MGRMICWFAAILWTVMLTGCASAVPEPAKVLSGDGWSGRVIDGATGQPLPGALVWIRWSTFSPGHSNAETCQHMDLAVTNAEGRYRMPPWRLENPPFAYGSLFRISEVYLRGYGRSREERGVQGNPDLLMPPWNGTDDERLYFLDGLRMQSHCIGGVDPNVKVMRAAIYRTLIAEFAGIPGARYPKNSLISPLDRWESYIVELEGRKK